MLNQGIFEEKLVSLTHNTEVLSANQQTKGILTADALIWQENGEQRVLPLDDVVGASIAPSQTKDQMACFVVNAYPKRVLGRFSQKCRRVLQEYRFACPDTEARSRWIRAIHNTLRGVSVDGFQTAAPRRLQILLNPMSGKRRRGAFLSECVLYLKKVIYTLQLQKPLVLVTPRRSSRKWLWRNSMVWLLSVATELSMKSLTV